MAVSLAYHVVVHALEGRGGLSPMARFGLAVRHTIDGHLPYARYQLAGNARRSERAPIGAVERAVADWLATDLNPAIQCMRQLTKPANAMWGYNQYNASASLGVRTRVDSFDQRGAGSTQRALIATIDDPEPCRNATLAVLDIVIKGVRARSRRPEDFPALRISQVARYLGVESSASCDVAAMLDRYGDMDVPMLARLMGVGVRTLERQLRAEGMTAVELRRAIRLMRATRRLGSGARLADIATQEGFSDGAHMTRSFQKACGLAPSMLRRVSHGASIPEHLTD